MPRRLQARRDEKRDGQANRDRLRHPVDTSKKQADRIFENPGMTARESAFHAGQSGRREPKKTEGWGWKHRD